MAVTPRVLIEAKQAENTQTTQYTASAVTAIVDKMTVTNTSASNATISVHLVAAAGAAGDANVVVDARTVAPGETYACPEVVGHVLASGGFVSTIASAASALTIRASGREVT